MLKTQPPTWEFQLLGSVQAFVDGHPVDLGQPAHLLVLALLLAARGNPIDTDGLIDRIWGAEGPPERARNQVHKITSQLRQTLRLHSGGHELLPPYDKGYRIILDPQQVDVHRFHDLVTAAQQSTGPFGKAEASSQWRKALAQWPTDASGLPPVEPLAGIPGRWADNYRHRLREDYRKAYLQCIDVELGLGKSEELIPELTSLSGVDPPDERVAVRLMTALCHAGRRGDVPQVYRAVRARLVNVGAKPGRELLQFYQRVPDYDPALEPDAAPQLPADAAFDGAGTENPGPEASLPPRPAGKARSGTGMTINGGVTAHRDVVFGDKITNHWSGDEYDA
ncbi:MAG TPA: AfsR/SARP family transcriptional regulator [Jatrophihabitantaceae bacterium]|nr:AfsR/SARP family transcriptional regulator [Jatrophihabitantaceae bacterium]